MSSSVARIKEHLQFSRVFVFVTSDSRDNRRYGILQTSDVDVLLLIEQRDGLHRAYVSRLNVVGWIASDCLEML